MSSLLVGYGDEGTAPFDNGEISNDAVRMLTASYSSLKASQSRLIVNSLPHAQTNDTMQAQPAT